MGTKKIIVGIFCIVLLIACEDKKNNFILKSEYDDLMKEYTELKSENSSNKKAIIEQSATLNKTLNELSEISNQTLVLRQSVEGGHAKISQAEKIQNNISAIKEKLEQFEKSLSKDDELKKTVSSLRRIIVEKEKEIKDLRDIISEQQNTIQTQETEISTQKNQITHQSNTITQKNKELEKAFANQVEFIYLAAVEFENMANEEITVSRKKNQKAVAEYKKRILKKAAEYYSIAARNGHAKAKTKANELRYLL